MSQPSSAVPQGPQVIVPPANFGEFLGHPRPLYTLFFAEMWERFSYYGMRALLTLYMVAPLAAGGMGLSTAQASTIYGTYVFSVYMLSIPGGSIADNILGSRMAVLIGGIVIAAGHFAMAFPSDFTFYLGLILIVLGTGLLKPNISAMVGQLYAPGDSRRDAGFSIFYLGINLGATIAPFVTGFLAQHSYFKGMLEGWGLDPSHSWHWGFGAAGVGMTLGVIVFLLYGNPLKEVGPPPPRTPGWWKSPVYTVLGAGLLWGVVWLSDWEGGMMNVLKVFEVHVPDLRWLRALFIVVPVGLMLWFGYSSSVEVRRLGAIYYFFIGAFIFWALFEQAGTSLNLFAERFTWTHVGRMEVPASWYQSANPLFVIMLAPVFAYLWTRMGDRQPSSPMKFTIGLFFLACGFALMVPAAKLALEGRVSPIWLIGLYFLQTVGEMFLSPVGLSTYTKLSPKHLVGAMLGVWFLGSAFGNKFAGVLSTAFGEGEADNLDRFFGQQALAVFAVTVLFLALVPWVRRRMGGVT
ncbi:MAG TPA: peptide MFS transporter [Opitutaceae bacterium]|nr:peptide MFS transporter [Opitutaceae bacterium]